MSGRRVVVRWVWRMFRREWRQQTLILALVGVTVAATICAVTAAYNLAPTPAATYGTATQRLRLDGSDARALRDARARLGRTEVIGHQDARLPGSADRFELRSQDPHGPYGSSMLRLLSGRYPTGPSEVALTTARSSVTLDGRAYKVVGRVENPKDLHDEFALVAPGTITPTSVTVLAHARHVTAIDGVRIEERGAATNGAVATGVLALATVALLLVSLVAAAGFAAVAQRRLRQIGMLAAVGAPDKHLRLVLLAHGAVVGAISAVTGTAAGVLAWFALAPALETAAGHRIDRFDLPWRLVVVAMLMAIATPTVAAWWPARTMARIPITAALSARPPRPHARARSSGVAALVCLAVGVGCLGLSNRTNPPLVLGGIVVIVAGILLISPLVIRLAARSAARAPITVRLALRDLGRYRARSGAALAAISLALGIPVALVVTAAAAQHTAAQGNLPDTQLLVRINGDEALMAPHSPAELARMRTAVDRFAGTLDRPSVVPLQVPVDASVKPALIVRLGRQTGSNSFHDVPLYVATPELIRYLGVTPDTDVLTPATGRLEYINTARRDLVPRTRHIAAPAYSASPTSVITPAAVRQSGWRPAQAAWLVRSGRPFTGRQIAAARDMAAGAGLSVESRDHQDGLRVVRSSATAAGVVLALAVLAMTVGTIRGEAAGELRTLTAAGATRTIRRTLTAVTTGTLALAGVVLGVIGAYLGLTGAYLGSLGTISRVPVADLVITVVGVPVLAALAGWLVAGREPDVIGRRPS